MKKILAMAAITISSTLIGLHLSKKMLSRVVELEKAKVFIVYCKTQIRYSSQDINTIIASYLEEHKDNLTIFMKENNLKFSSSSIQSQIISALDSPKVRQNLKETDISCLKSFISSLGTGDIESQTALCNLYEQLIQERFASAKQSADKYAGIYTSLCVLCGLAISILLI